MKRPWTFPILALLSLIVLAMISWDSIRSLWGDSDDPNLVRIDDAGGNRSGERVGTQALNANDNGQVLSNDEVGIQVELPASWSATDQLHDSAELQAADPEQQLYLVVVGEDADALMRMGLEENAARYRSLIAQQLAVYEGESKTDVAFVGDDFATQYVMRGRLEDNTPVVYLHTTVVSENQYYQVVTWTTPEQFENYRSELQTITDSFREIGS